MTEETILPDTPPSTNEITPEQPPAPDAKADEGAAVDSGEEGSILGGEPAGDDAAADAADAPVIPDAYDLKLEGVELDKESLEVATPVFKELGLTNDQANKLMPVADAFRERVANATLQQMIDAGAQQKAEWASAAKADPEIGGAKFEETTHLAGKALDYLGYPAGSDFRKALTETGFGNHPEMIRAMRKVGEMLGEDGFARSDAGPQGDPLAEMYPNNRRSKT